MFNPTPATLIPTATEFLDYLQTHPEKKIRIEVYMRNTAPTTEEFLDYLKNHPDAKNKDIADYFGIAPTTASKLKSQIKNNKRPEVKGTFTNLAVKGSVKVSDLTPEDPDWWHYSVKKHGELAKDGAIRPVVKDAMLNLKNKYPKQLPAVKSQITAFYDQFRHHSSPDMTLEEFSAVIRGLKAMMKVEPIDVQARYGNKPKYVVQHPEKQS